MACGEIIAVVLECGRLFDEDFLDLYLSDLIELTTNLAKDSQKFRAKKERKAQRASFRDVLRYLEVSYPYRSSLLRILINSLLFLLSSDFFRKTLHQRSRYVLAKKLSNWTHGQ